MSLVLETIPEAEARATISVAVAIADPELRSRVVATLGNSPASLTCENCQTGTLEELLTGLERLRPEILLLGLSGLPDDAAVVLSGIENLKPAPRVIAVNETAEPELILRAMRAGAVEFVYPPFETHLNDALCRVVAEQNRLAQPESETGAAIGFVSAKGGCGATTIACHASSYLNREKKAVLLADLDTSSGMAGQLMRCSAGYSMEDAVQHMHRMDLKLWKALVSNSPSGVDVMPSAADSPNRDSVSSGFHRLMRFWRTQYEFTIVDLGHGLSASLLGALESLDGVVLVSTNEVPALRQARQIIQSLVRRNFPVDYLKLVVNRMPRRAEIQSAELEKVMGHPIYAVLPNDYRTLNEAYSKSRLAGFDTVFGAALSEFAARMAGLEPPAKKARGSFWFGKESPGKDG